MRTPTKSTLRLAASILALSALAACTVVNTATLPPAAPNSHTPFVTTGDIAQPYQSLGLVQTTRKGVLLFGFVDAVGTDLQTGFADVLIPLARQMGGDGVINVRFHQTQYLPLTQAIFAVLFIFPLPTSVTITGEVVKLLPNTAPPAPAT